MTKKHLLYCSLVTVFLSLVGLHFLPLHEPVVGDVSIESIGIGDRITHVDKQSISSWEELITEIAEKSNAPVKIKLQTHDGNEAEIAIPVIQNSFRWLGIDRNIGFIKGLTNRRELPRLFLTPHSPLKALGVSSGDQVEKLNGSPILSWSDLLHQLNNVPSTKPLNFDLIKEKGDQRFTIAMATIGEKYSLRTVGLFAPNQVIKKVGNGIGKQIGLKDGDVFLLLQGIPFSEKINWDRFFQSLQNEKNVLRVSVIRGDRIQNLSGQVSSSKPPIGLKWGTESFFGIQTQSEWLESRRTAKGSIALKLKYWIKFKLWAQFGTPLNPSASVD